MIAVIGLGIPYENITYCSVEGSNSAQIWPEKLYRYEHVIEEGTLQEKIK